MTAWTVGELGLCGPDALSGGPGGVTAAVAGPGREDRVTDPTGAADGPPGPPDDHGARWPDHCPLPHHPAAAGTPDTTPTGRTCPTCATDPCRELAACERPAVAELLVLLEAGADPAAVAVEALRALADSRAGRDAAAREFSLVLAARDRRIACPECDVEHRLHRQP